MTIQVQTVTARRRGPVVTLHCGRRGLQGPAGAVDWSSLASRPLSNDGMQILARDPGSGSTTKMFTLHVTALKPALFDRSKRVLSTDTDFLVRVDPLYWDELHVYQNLSGQTVRYQLEGIDFHQEGTLFNNSASTSILDFGPRAAVTGMDGAILTTVPGQQIVLYPGEAIKIRKYSSGIFAITAGRFLLAAGATGAFNWFQTTDRLFTLYGRGSISGSSTVVTITLPSLFQNCLLEHGSGSSGAVIVLSSVRRAGASADLTPTPLQAYNILDSSTGNVAKFDILNVDAATYLYSFAIHGLDLLLPRVYAGSRVPASDRPIAVGQSIANQLNYQTMGWWYADELQSKVGLGAIPNKVSFTKIAAFGGSHITRTAYNADLANIDPGDPNDMIPTYWVDDTNPLSLADGLLLTSAVGLINGHLTADVPTHIIFDLGQTEAAYLITNPSYAATELACVQYIIARLRATITAKGGVASAPVYICITGRASGDTGGYELIRQVLGDAIDEPNGIYRGPEEYDLWTEGVVHPSPVEEGQFRHGKRLAWLRARDGYSITGLFTGPSVAFNLVNSTTVTATITSETGDSAVLPSSPWGFRFEDSANPGVAISSSISKAGNVYTFHLEGQITGSLVPFYPWTTDGTFDRDNYIYGSVSFQPLKTYFR